MNIRQKKSHVPCEAVVNLYSFFSFFEEIACTFLDLIRTNKSMLTCLLHRVKKPTRLLPLWNLYFVCHDIHYVIHFIKSSCLDSMEYKSLTCTRISTMYVCTYASIINQLNFQAMMREVDFGELSIHLFFMDIVNEQAKL